MQLKDKFTTANFFEYHIIMISMNTGKFLIDLNLKSGQSFWHKVLTLTAIENCTWCIFSGFPLVRTCVICVHFLIARLYLAIYCICKGVTCRYLQSLVKHCQTLLWKVHVCGAILWFCTVHCPTRLHCCILWQSIEILWQDYGSNIEFTGTCIFIYA